MTFDELNERDAWRALVWIVRAADLYFADPKGPGSRPKWRIVDGRPETHPIREWRAGAIASELRTWAEAVRTLHPELTLPPLPASIGADEDAKMIGLWAKTAFVGLAKSGGHALPGSATSTKRGGGKRPKIDGEARALAILVKHPDWSNGRIAEETGLHVKSLSRYRRFADARKMLQESGKQEFAHGTKATDGDFDAYE